MGSIIAESKVHKHAVGPFAGVELIISLFAEDFAEAVFGGANLDTGAFFLEEHGYAGIAVGPAADHGLSELLEGEVG